MEDDLDPGPGPSVARSPSKNRDRNKNRGSTVDQKGGSQRVNWRSKGYDGQPSGQSFESRVQLQKLQTLGRSESRNGTSTTHRESTNQNQRFNQRRNYNSNKNTHKRIVPVVKILDLEEIAKSDSQDALTKLIANKEAFKDLLQSNIEKLDSFALVIECMAKVCQSSFDELKLNILRETCNSKFIVSLNSYLLELPYVTNKLSNKKYWKNQDDFWKNLVVFLEKIVNTSPSLALNKCRSLMEATPNICLEGLKEKHSYNLPEEYATKFTDLREKLAEFEKLKETGTTPRKQFNRGRAGDDAIPPENFRMLDVLPTTDDLLHEQPFLRPNIVDGAYKDVEHYLDVQFRLLREDCFGPLRDGLSQYMKDPKKRKYDHIRVIHNVKFVKPYISSTKIGSLIQIDMKTNKQLRNIDWRNSQRFIYGSLVLFTKDDCKNFLVATILDRELRALRDGLIPVSLMETQFEEQLYNDDTYTMIESEVYFEPYYHVLRALQEPSFRWHLAMQQYIVHVNPDPKPPSYLKPETTFRVQQSPTKPSSALEDEIRLVTDLFSHTEIMTKRLTKNKPLSFTVLQEDTWPGNDTLQFNESQMEAYKLALTHELAVIQGPPGTGKTYLGIKVAETLYQNLKEQPGCLMLVICYTNHALDQFLEALLKVSDSVARIGGQSRNAAMEPINLTNLRHIRLRRDRNRSPDYLQEMYSKHRSNLMSTVSLFQSTVVHIDVLLNGVIKCKHIDDIPEIKLLNNYYNFPRGKQDALYHWLFAHIADYYTDFGVLECDEYSNNNYDDIEKETRRRIGVEVDDLDLTECDQSRDRADLSFFSMEETNTKLRELMAKYRSCRDPIGLRVLRMSINQLNAQKALFNDMSQYRSRRTHIQITENTNFNNFTPAERWTLYFNWTRIKLLHLKRKIQYLQVEVSEATEMYEEARMMVDLNVLRKRKIIGMTTTGAARMRKLLKALAPKIVIVEEAAEVLEQHIITSLTEDCQHLILIGDHQQLRPSASHVKLARHYQLEVSLFERMVTNGIHSRRLGVQHRMRPEVAALVCPHIYRDLRNHPSVHDLPDVKGLTANLFFFTHDHKEEALVESTSKINKKEADIVLALANYLIKQGYSAFDVTILTAYKGQMFYLKKESVKYIYLKDVKITAVDNYQGEESKIILLSLVRNNEDNKIGFLGTPNRICVALSRAKEGFYIFGNIDILKSNSKLWRDIASTLEDSNSLGTSLTLRCQNHTNTTTIISKVEDFEQVPEGGCNVPCEFLLRKCGHPCELFCHVYDREHETDLTRCARKCERILCDLGHVCRKSCADECGPCNRKMRKTLPCGHEQDVACHLKPSDPKISCNAGVDVILPDCGHQVQKRCHENIMNVVCSIKCGKRVEKCGHECRLHCHVKDDPNHEKYVCQQDCTKAKAGCTAGLEGNRGDHQCLMLCFETCSDCTVQVDKRRSTCIHTERVPCNTDVDKIPCMKNCARKLPCDHFCKKKCSDICGNCMEMVTKEIPDCKHKVKLLCKQEPVRALCNQNCERTMTCGHKCKGICGIECDPTLCTEPSDRKAEAKCGHQVTLPCNLADLPLESRDPEKLAASCAVACGAELACGHACAGSCSGCRRGTLHAPCTQPCKQINICEHQCDAPCNQICPPCKKPCEVKCQHSQCRSVCGELCSPCQETCAPQCSHGGDACRMRCSETYVRAACDEPCGLQLPCGHPCRGLCGEPCPPVCRACDPDNFPTDFLGDQFDDARFILLQDCGHVVEVKNMDNLMLGDRDAIEIRKCPLCRKPVINTGRYKDRVNYVFRHEINPIKTKIYGTKEQIDEKRDELAQNIQEFRDKYLNVIVANKYIKTVYLNLHNVAKTKKKISKAHLEMEITCLNILDIITECYKNYLDDNLTELKKELTKQSELLCGVFAFKVNAGVMLKVSEQQQKDLGLEIKRMHGIVQLAKLTGHGTFAAARGGARVQAALAAARAAVFSWAAFDEAGAMRALRELQEAMQVSGVVTKQEKDMIVRAIGLKAGHWYKCRNGHFYCIGECGGAMEESQCPECDV